MLDDGDDKWIKKPFVHKYQIKAYLNAIADKDYKPFIKYGGKSFNRIKEDRYYEGWEVGAKYITHESDSEDLRDSEIYEIGIPAYPEDECLAYWDPKEKYLKKGKVTRIE